MNRWLIVLGICPGLWLTSVYTANEAIGQTPAQAAPSVADRDNAAAWILLYHHISHDTPASTSVTPDTFEQHLEYLESHNFRVVPLTEIIDSLDSGRALDSRSVAITFDDAFESIYSQAFPRLRARNWPFTIFVSTAAVDRGGKTYLSWQQLRTMELAGATIANHSRTHDHLVRRGVSESVSQWRTRVSADIEQAQSRLREELAAPAKLFAYPYGEVTPGLSNLVQDLGYPAFGQQSGPVGGAVDKMVIPRFPLASGFDDIPSLAEKLRTRRLPVSVLNPLTPLLAAHVARPTLELAIAPGPFDLARLTCYVAGQPPAVLVQPEREAGESATVQITAALPLPSGRSKYTCTAPSTIQSGVYYWYSHLWLKPKADGTWYEG